VTARQVSSPIPSIGTQPSLPDGHGWPLGAAGAGRSSRWAALATGLFHEPFYGVVSAQTEKVVEFFLERDAAEAMIREVREDEPVLAEDLRVEVVELD